MEPIINLYTNFLYYGKENKKLVDGKKKVIMLIDNFCNKEDSDENYYGTSIEDQYACDMYNAMKITLMEKI